MLVLNKVSFGKMSIPGEVREFRTTSTLPTLPLVLQPFRSSKSSEKKESLEPAACFTTPKFRERRRERLLGTPAVPRASAPTAEATW
jgi:hypothetical protein